MLKPIDEIIGISKTSSADVVASVNAQQLPKELSDFADQYEHLDWSRSRFLWRWVWELTYARSPGLMLSSVPEECRLTAALTKSLLVMAATIVDDVSDKLNDGPLLKVLLKAPFEPIRIPNHFHGSRRLSVELVEELINSAFSLLRRGEMWNKVQPVLEFDLKQVWTSFGYAHLINDRPEFINHLENSNYSAHNMMLYVFGDIDLVYSPRFDSDGDGSPLREVVWHAQQMARIGNWVSTWEREFSEHDMSSGVVSFGLSNRLIGASDLRINGNANGSRSLQRRCRRLGIERQLLNHWSIHREEAMRAGMGIRSVNVSEYVDGLEMLLIYHLASRGQK